MKRSAGLRAQDGRKLPTLFLDRDGTLIEEHDYLADPKQVRLLPGVSSGLRRLGRAGFRVVVVSNQSGVGRGLIRPAQLAAVQKKFLALLRGRRAPIDGYYWCPHTPEANCSCRKPKSGLLRRASRELGIPWKRSLSLGDRASDVALGQRTGGWGVFILTGYGRRNRRKLGRVIPDHVARDFSGFVTWILQHKGKDGTWTLH